MTSFDLAPVGNELFAGREKRRSVIAPDAWQKLGELELATKQPGYAELQVDRQASAIWLAGRVNRPTEDVLANFDSVARAYFGQDMTPGQAYDRIVEREQQVLGMGQQAAAGQTAGDLPKVGEVEGVDGEKPVEPKGWQFLRTFTAGMSKTGHDTVGGTLALVEGALNTLGGIPKRKGIAEDTDYQNAVFELGVLEYEDAADTPEGASLRQRVEAGRIRADEAFKASMEEYKATTRGSLAADARKGADFFYELGNASAEFYGVDETYRDSIVGKAAEMGGSMLASSALLAAGSLGMLGRIKGVGTAARRLADVAGTGQIYAGVEQDRQAVEGDAYANTGWTFAASLANAGVQQVIERAPFLDNTLERAIKNVPIKNGTLSLGDVLRQLPRQALADGIREGGEEVLQGAWDDFISDQAYDDTRVDVSNGKLEYLQRRTAEALAGFAGGVMLGGAFGGAAAFDQNREVKRAERAFAAKAGDPLTAEEFRIMRRVRTDEQIRALPDGDVLLAAANGDLKAQEAYNRTLFDKNFIKTDGISAFGVTVGEYKGMPALAYEDGRRVAFNTQDAAEMATFNAMRRKVAGAAAGNKALAELQLRFGMDLTIERPAELPTIQDMVDAGTITAEQAADAVKAAQDLGGLAKDLPWSQITPKGTARVEQDGPTKMWQMVTQVLQGQAPDVAIEEVSEAWLKKAVMEGQLDRMELRTLRQDWHVQNNEADPAADGVTPERADVEWFSKRVVEYAVAGKHAELTGKWWQWVRQLGDKLRAFLQGAKRMRAAMQEGKLDPRLEGWFKAALGMGPEGMKAAESAFSQKESAGEVQMRELAQMDEVSVQEAMASESYPKITGNAGDGFVVRSPEGEQIGAAQELDEANAVAMNWWMQREAQAEREQAEGDAGNEQRDELMEVIRRVGGLRAASMESVMKGELKAISENMTLADRLRTFRKDGADLDRLREVLVGEGFDYKTPAELLDAIEKSVRGVKQYGTFTNPDGLTTFSLDYQGDHGAPMKDSGSPLHNVVGSYPADVYSFNGLRYYATGNESLDREAYEKIMWAKDKPNGILTVYRAVPKDVKGGINVGDWVTTVRRYALEHGRSHLGGNYRIIQKIVHPRDIFTAGDSWLEWGYDPQPFDKEAETARRARRAAKQAENQNPDITFSIAPSVESEAFKRWFKDSKVVDVQGRPLVVYHGTNADFSIFDSAKLGANKARPAHVGFWFADDPQYAAFHGDAVMPVYLALKNPAVIKDADALQNLDPAKVEALKKAGHDGVMIPAKEEKLGKSTVRSAAIYAAFKPEQVKSATGNKGTFDPYNPDITFSLAPAVESDAFKRWFGKSKVVDSKGKPLVLYHGTPGDFSVFQQDRANPESDFGAGFYFSNTPDDVASNYAGIGQDLEHKIELRAEQIDQEEEIGMDEARERAKGELMSHLGATMPVFIRMENPAVVGGKGETSLEMEQELDENDDPTGEESGTLVDFIMALRDAASMYGDGDVEAAIGALLESANYESIKLSDAIEVLKKSEGFNYFTDDNGRFMSNEIIRKALERAGFDGIIDQTVDVKFGSQRRIGKKMVGMTSKTVHYIAFSSENVKSATGNKGTFDPNNPDITFALAPNTETQAFKDYTGVVAENGKPVSSGPDWELQVASFYHGPAFEVTQATIGGTRVEFSVGQDRFRLRSPIPSRENNFNRSQDWFLIFDSEGQLIREQGRIPQSDRDAIIAEGVRLATNRAPVAGDVFLRFGPLPKGGKSKNHATGQQEAGVSVYRAEWNPAFQRYTLADADHAGTAIDLIYQGKKPMLLSGRVVGRGSDGEPVLAEARKVADVVFSEKGFALRESPNSAINPDISFSIAPNGDLGAPATQPATSRPGAQPRQIPPDFAAIQRKVDDIWAKHMQEQGFAELVRMRNEGYVDALVTARAKHDTPAALAIDKLISPLDETLRRLGVPQAAAALRRATADANIRKARDRNVVRAITEKLMQLDEGTAFIFDRARLNGDRATMDALAARYGFTAELDATFAMFDRIRQEAIAAGVPYGTFWEAPAEKPKGAAAAIKAAGADGAAIEAALQANGYTLRIENYWPRNVIDYDEYLAYLTGTEAGSSIVGRAYQLALAKAKKAGREALTTDELDEIASTGAAALRRVTGTGRKPSALKRRKIDEIAPEAVRFYKKPNDSAYAHVDRMHDYIAMLTFFGKSVRTQEAAVEGATPPMDVKESIAAYIADQGKAYTKKQEDAIRDALTARFHYMGSPSIINTIRTLGYLQGMTQIYTTITAVVPDMWSIAVESNFDLTAFVGAIYQTATGKNAADLSSFGLDARRMHMEFQTQMSSRLSRFAAKKLGLKGKAKARVEAITLANTLQAIFSAIGLNRWNDFVQQTRANAEAIALRKAAKRGSLSRIQQSRIDRTFLPEERAQLMQDIAAGKGVQESPLVAYYAWAGLADYMPVSLDQMPVQYLKSPNGRLFYMYKTFLVMQTAAIRRESIDAIVRGVEEKDVKQIAYGLGMMLFMVSLMLAFSMPPDMIRAYIQGRPYVLEDEFYNRLGGLIGVSHFVAQKARTDLGGAAAAYFMPPTSIFPDAYRDAEDLLDAAQYGMLEDFDMTKFRTWNYTPVVGRAYQGWLGSDSEKRQRELEGEGFFRLAAPKAEEDRADDARKRWLMERYNSR